MKLKPCPFGDDHNFTSIAGGSAVHCETCDLFMAIRKWNTRPSERAAAERMREACIGRANIVADQCRKDYDEQLHLPMAAAGIAADKIASEIASLNIDRVLEDRT